MSNAMVGTLKLECILPVKMIEHRMMSNDEQSTAWLPRTKLSKQNI